MTETGVETGKTSGGCPRWMKLTLIVSLMLNVAVIGMFAGHNMKGDEKAAGGAGNRQVEWILRLVPEERRDYTKAHFGDIRDQMKSLRTERQEKLDDIVAAVRADPFIPDALAAALEDRRAASTQTRTLVHQRLVILMEEFRPEERAVFAERLEERVSNWRQARGN